VNWIRSQPEDFWNEERRTAWKERLRPIVEFYKEL
jgi:hypothetical protein